MKKFRLSEIIFMLIGLILTFSSILLLHYNISLVQFFNLHLSPGDPFQASYYLGTETQTPGQTANVAQPNASPTSTPIQVVTESPELRLYLVAPLNQAVLTYPKKHAPGPEKILFKFEVYPKSTPTTFELLLKDKVIFTKAIPQTLSGLHELSVEIEKLGLYQWRVKAFDITSELRSFTLHE